MPNIIIQYSRRNSLRVAEYVVDVKFVYRFAFLVGMLLGTLLLFLLNKRQLALQKKQKETLAKAENINQIRGGADERDEAAQFLEKFFEEFYKFWFVAHYQVFALAYPELLLSPLNCLEPGYYEVINPKILPIINLILGEHRVGPNGLHEPRLISPSLYIMGSIVLANAKIRKLFDLSPNLDLRVIKKVLLEIALKELKIQKGLRFIELKNVPEILFRNNLTIVVPVTGPVILATVGKFTILLAETFPVIFYWNLLKALVAGVVFAGFIVGAVASLLGIQSLMFYPTAVQVFSALLAFRLTMETINPIVCNTMLKALPSNETHVEYCLPEPTMAPYAPAKDKIILHVKKANEPEKILYLRISQEEEYARCQKEEFSKTPEGTILEALDMTYHLSSSPTPIQNYCKQNKDDRVIPITETIKTRSDVKSHDERYVREETDRNLELLEKRGIVEDGNWYGAKKPVSTQFKIRKGSKQYTLKKPMTLKDLPQENPFVQEDMPQVAQKQKVSLSLPDKDKDT